MVIINIYIILIGLFQLSNGYMFYNETQIQINYSNDLQRALKVTDISSKCKVQFLQYVKSLISKESEDFWAKQMFDAGSKIPSGLLSVPTADLGDFDECINIEAITESYEIYGQYCLATIPLSTEAAQREEPFILRDPETKIVTPGGGISIRLATCLPNDCSAADIQKIYSAIGLGLVFSEDLCQTTASQPKLDAGSIATILFLAIIFGAMLLSTVYDTALHYSDKKSEHPMLTAFSILTNTKKILATSSGSNQISCLHGMRVISIMWIMLLHKFTGSTELPLKNNLEVLDWVNNVSSMYVLSATIAVDTFLLMAGIVISYSYMGDIKKGKKFNIILHYIHRYIRLTPVLAIIILLIVTLLKHFGSGPLWSYSVHKYLEYNCQKNWWKALLHIQNYGDIKLCLPVSWYLSVDMQLVLLSPIILIPLRRWPVFTLAATGFLTICSILISFLTAWFFELRTSPLSKADATTSSNYTKYFYLATQTRAGPWFIGIILGYVIFRVKQRKTKIVINKIIVIFVWIASLAVLCTCVFGSHHLIFNEYDRLAHSINISLVRPAWAVALSFIILACVTGYGGPINWFLSLPTFQVLSKLTFAMYLVHVPIRYFTVAQMRDVPRLSDSQLAYTFWGDFALTVFVSYILCLMFEVPITTIERHLLGKDKRESPSELPKTTTVTSS